MSQAAIALRADSVSAKPFNIKDDGQSGHSDADSVSKTRRGLLAGIVATPFAAVALASSTNVGADEGDATMNMQVFNLKTRNDAAAADASDWKDVVARYRAAEREEDHFLDTVYNPAVDECCRRTGCPPEGVYILKAKNGKTAKFVFDRHNPDEFANYPVVAVRNWANKTKSESENFFENLERVKTDIGMDDIDAEDDRLSKRVYAMRDEVLQTRVPDAAALLEKLEICWEDGRDGDVLREHIFRDVRHLNAIDLTLKH